MSAESIRPASQVVSDQVGTRLLFENERVRVWDLRLAPGQSTGMHRHATDYLYVVIGDGVLTGIDREGKPKETTAFRDGDVRFRAIDDADVHEAINAGSGPWRNIVVELKEPRTPQCDAG